MKYKSYQHIEKLGKSEVDGILKGTCYISYKIDGTNGCIFYDEGEIKFGSRSRELNYKEGKDNQGFSVLIATGEKYKPMYEDLQKFFERYPNYIIYGEWLVNGTIKRYKEDAKKQFYIFDIYDPENDVYINYDDYKNELDHNFPNLKYIPLLAKLENPKVEDLEALLDKTGDFLITEGKGEGIVIKNYKFRNIYGRTTWAKLLTEDFIKAKAHTRQENKSLKEQSPIEYDISKLMTIEHISKEYNKLLENKQTEWEMKYIPELFQRAFTEFLNDNLELILKKFHNPTINFHVLKKLCDDRVKEFVLNKEKERASING